MRRFGGSMWVVALVMGRLQAAEPAGAVSPAEGLAAAKAHATARGYTPARPEPEGDFSPTEADRARGFAVFVRSANLPLYLHSVPSKDERVEAIYAYGAPGETVSVQVAVRSLAAHEAVAVRVGDLKGPAGVIPADRIRCRWIEYAPIRRSGRRRPGEPTRPETSQIVPLRIRSMPAGGLNLPADWTQGYWITLGLPSGAAPGRYEGRLDVLLRDKVTATMPVVVTVLPVELKEPRSLFFGAFLMLSGRPDGPYVHTVAQLKDLADRGIHGILWFWGHYGLDVRRVDDALKMDFARLDTYMDRVMQAGLKGPVVLALGNDSRGHLEQAIAELWDLPLRRETDRPERAADRTFAVGTLDCPQLDALYIEALRQLLEHAKAKRWPEIVLLPYDEPTERLEKEYVHRATLIRKAFPETRIYGVVMGDEDALSWLGPPSDILVTNGRPEAIRRYAAAHAKTFWTYGGRVQAAQPFGRARTDYGRYPWSLRSAGHWFWAYNWHVGDPMDEFDGSVGDASWVVAYPPERPGEPCVPSPAFEGMRAGVDDVRYVEALEDLLGQLPAEKAQPFRDRLAALRRESGRPAMAPAGGPRGVGPQAPRPAPLPPMAFPTGPVTAADALRLRTIEMILEVRALVPR